MKYLFIKISIITTLLFAGCNNNDWLDRDPENIITDEQLWNDPKMITSLLANFYDRLPSLHGNFNTGGMSEIDDAMWSGHQDQNGKMISNMETTMVDTGIMNLSETSTSLLTILINIHQN